MRDLWLARNTVIEMLLSRGCSTTQQVVDFPQFSNQFPSADSNPSILNFISSNPLSNSPYAVHFSTDSKLGKSSLERLLHDYSSQSINIVILITPAKLNASCKSYIKNIQIEVEHFLIEQLQLNVTKHVLVPQHRIMNEEEKIELLNKLKTKQENLPVILTSDVVCRYIGGKEGDIIEIKRKSATAGTALYYRRVKEII